MSDPLVLIALALAGIALIAFALRAALARRATLAQLREPAERAQVPARRPATRRSRLGINRAPLIGVLVGVAGFVLGFTGPSIPLEFTLSWAFIGGALAYVIADIHAGRVVHRLETQLADAIDLMVSSLRAGSGWSDALVNATREVRRPLRPLLEHALARLRFGESASVVFEELADRVPLESFSLFSLTQQVQQGVGGSVAKGLAAVSRFVRDRIEQRRMAASQSTMARLSMLFVTLLTYLIAVVIWFNDPERSMLFLGGPVGRPLAAGAMALQAVGVLWITQLSRVRD